MGLNSPFCTAIPFMVVGRECNVFYFKRLTEVVELLSAEAQSIGGYDLFSVRPSFLKSQLSDDIMDSAISA